MIIIITITIGDKNTDELEKNNEACTHNLFVCVCMCEWVSE